MSAIGLPPKPYVDKTGTMDKPNPMRDVYQEFPRAMMLIAEVTAFGAKKHAPRGWRTFDNLYGMDYCLGKIGRHLLGQEKEGPVNYADGGVLHMAQSAWSHLAWLEFYARENEKPPMVSRETARPLSKDEQAFAAFEQLVKREEAGYDDIDPAADNSKLARFRRLHPKLEGNWGPWIDCDCDKCIEFAIFK